MSIANFFAAWQELIVQSVDLARLMGRDILLTRGSQFMFGWLVVETIANRPWPLVNWLGVPRVSCKRSVTNRDSRHCQHRVNENGTS
jgi:hypothetical protein